MILTRDDMLPFIETSQYMEFALACDYTRQHHIMMLCSGKTGAGKTAAALRYAGSRQRMTGNGLSPSLYVQLAPSDKTDRPLNNTLVAAIKREEREDRSAAVARGEVIRLIDRYGYDSLILDEGGYMAESGYEETRTLHDLLGRFPIIIIVMPKHVTRIENKAPAFYSRISEHMDFGTLNIEQIRNDVLPNLSRHSHLKMPASWQERDKIVRELAALARGNFRDLVDILVKTNALIQESIEQHERWIAEIPDEKPSDIKAFNTETIQEAARKAKRRGTSAQQDQKDISDGAERQLGADGANLNQTSETDLTSSHDMDRAA